MMKHIKRYSENFTEQEELDARRLCQDITRIFEERWVDYIPTHDLITHLVKIPDSPWSTYNSRKKDKRICNKHLGKLLGHYCIHSGTIKVNGEWRRGYTRGHFAKLDNIISYDFLRWLLKYWPDHTISLQGACGWSSDKELVLSVVADLEKNGWLVKSSSKLGIGMVTWRIQSKYEKDSDRGRKYNPKSEIHQPEIRLSLDSPWNVSTRDRPKEIGSKSGEFVPIDLNIKPNIVAGDYNPVRSTKDKFMPGIHTLIEEYVANPSTQRSDMDILITTMLEYLYKDICTHYKDVIDQNGAISAMYINRESTLRKRAIQIGIFFITFAFLLGMMVGS